MKFNIEFNLVPFSLHRTKSRSAAIVAKDVSGLVNKRQNLFLSVLPSSGLIIIFAKI